MNRSFLSCRMCCRIARVFAALALVFVMGDFPVAAAPAVGSFTGIAANLDDAATWGTYIDPPGRTLGYSVDHVRNPTNESGTALRIALASGQPYTGILAYQSLAATPDATHFHLAFRWRFSATSLNNEGKPSSVQAVEFAFDRYTASKRYEFALQWENVADGSKHSAVAPGWRLWTGTGWQEIGVGQRLAPDQWHQLTLEGDLTANGAVQYRFFTSDDTAVSLGQRFLPVATQGTERNAVTFQLDGNYAADPCQVLFDDVTVMWA